MIEYTFAQAKNPVFLSIAVHKLLKEGWRPHGSPVMFHQDICQAMTREVKDKK